MFLFSTLINLNNRLLAYDFVSDSGLEKTGKQTGYASSIFSGGLLNGVGTMVSAFLALLGVIFLVLIIYAGITWMIAEGDEAKVEKAKKILVQAIIGLVIVMAAYAISFFVISALAPN